MKKLSFFVLLMVIVTVKPISAFCQDIKAEKKIIYTTLDVKQDYEIITIIGTPVDISTSFGNPVGKAYNAAWEQFMKTAESIGADAVVGIRIEIENINSQIVGRLLMYGTAVKFTDK